MVAVVLGLLWLWAGFSVQPSFAQGAATVAVTGARLIDGTGRPPIEQATLLIEDGRVRAAGPSASIQIPAEAVRVDATGKTIIPGLISSHTHVGSKEQRLLYAQYGITTVYSLGSGPGNAALQDEVTFDRARVFGAPGVRATSADEGRRLVDSIVAPNVHMIKIWVFGDPQPVASPQGAVPPFTDPNRPYPPPDPPPDPTPEVYRAIIDQAHKHGISVAAHVWYQSDALALAEAGVDVLAHNVRDRDVDAAFVAELKRRNVAVIPTLSKGGRGVCVRIDARLLQRPILPAPCRPRTDGRGERSRLPGGGTENPTHGRRERGAGAGQSESQEAGGRRRHDCHGHRYGTPTPIPLARLL